MEGYISPCWIEPLGKAFVPGHCNWLSLYLPTEFVCVCERFWSASLFISFSIHVAVLYCFDPQHIGSSRNHENGSHGSFLKRAGQTFMLLNYVKSIPLLRRHPQMYRKKGVFPLHTFHDWRSLDPTNYSSCQSSQRPLGWSTNTALPFGGI